MAEQALRTRIRTQVENAAREQVARKLIENWDKLGMVIEGLPQQVPTMAEMMGDPNAPEGSDARLGIAGQLIQRREATFGGRRISLSTLDQELDAFVTTGPGREMPGAREMRESLGKVDELVPNSTALDEIADATARGVESQTGTGNKIWTFIKAIGSWLMSAIGSLFGGGPMISFSEALASSAAPGVGDAVRNNLNALANDPTKASSRLLRFQDASGRTTIDTITNMAIAGTYTELGATPPPAVAPPPAPAASTQPIGVDMGAMRSAIARQINNPPPVNGQPQPSLSDSIYAQLVEGRNKARDAMYLLDPRRLAVPSDETLRTAANSMADTISVTISGRIADPNFRTADGKRLSELSKEDFSRVMAEEVGRELEKSEREGRLRLGNFTSLGDKMEGDKTYLAFIKEQVQGQLSGRYDQIRPALQIVARLRPEQLQPRNQVITAAFDRNNDNTLSTDEITAIAATLRQARVADRNNDGVISDEEVAAVGSNADAGLLRRVIAADNVMKTNGLDAGTANLATITEKLLSMGVTVTQGLGGAPLPASPGGQPPAPGRGGR